MYRMAAAIRTKRERLHSSLYSSGMDGFRAHELLLVVAAASPWLPAFVCIDFHSQSGVARVSHRVAVLHTCLRYLHTIRRRAMPLILASPKTSWHIPSAACGLCVFVAPLLPIFFGVISFKPVFCGGGSSRAHISCVVLRHSGRQGSPGPVGRASVLDGP